MSQSLYLVSNKTKIGVIRNPYERAVTEYQNSLNYIGFDEWLQANPMQSQKEVEQKFLFCNLEQNRKTQK